MREFQATGAAAWRMMSPDPDLALSERSRAVLKQFAAAAGQEVAPGSVRLLAEKIRHFLAYLDRPAGVLSARSPQTTSGVSWGPRTRRPGRHHPLPPKPSYSKRAITIAESIPTDCLEHYAFTKRATQAAALRDIADLADPLDRELPTWMTSPNAQHAHRRYWKQLKDTEPTW